MLQSHVAVALAITLSVSACGTLAEVETAHPQVTADVKGVLVFAPCLDILTAPLVKHAVAGERPDWRQTVNDALEAIRCAQHVRVDLETELAKDATTSGGEAPAAERSPAVLPPSFPLPPVVLPADAPEVSPNPYKPVG